MDSILQAFHRFLTIVQYSIDPASALSIIQFGLSFLVLIRRDKRYRPFLVLSQAFLGLSEYCDLIAFDELFNLVLDLFGFGLIGFARFK